MDDKIEVRIMNEFARINRWNLLVLLLQHRHLIHEEVSLIELFDLETATKTVRPTNVNERKDEMQKPSETFSLMTLRIQDEPTSGESDVPERTQRLPHLQMGGG